jgi:IS30 family transposase
MNQGFGAPQVSRMPVHLTAQQRQLALRLKARGLSLREIGPQVGCSHQGVALIARHRPRRLVGRTAGCLDQGG